MASPAAFALGKGSSWLVSGGKAQGIFYNQVNPVCLGWAPEQWRPLGAGGGALGTAPQKQDYFSLLKCFWEPLALGAPWLHSEEAGRPKCPGCCWVGGGSEPEPLRGPMAGPVFPVLLEPAAAGYFSDPQLLLRADPAAVVHRILSSAFCCTQPGLCPGLQLKTVP